MLLGSKDLSEQQKMRVDVWLALLVGYLSSTCSNCWDSCRRNGRPSSFRFPRSIIGDWGCRGVFGHALDAMIACEIRALNLSNAATNVFLPHYIFTGWVFFSSRTPLYRKIFKRGANPLHLVLVGSGSILKVFYTLFNNLTFLQFSFFTLFSQISYHPSKATSLRKHSFLIVLFTIVELLYPNKPCRISKLKLLFTEKHWKWKSMLKFWTKRNEVLLEPICCYLLHKKFMNSSMIFDGISGFFCQFFPAVWQTDKDWGTCEIVSRSFSSTIQSNFLINKFCHWITQTVLCSNHFWVSHTFQDSTESCFVLLGTDRIDIAFLIINKNETPLKSLTLMRSPVTFSRIFWFQCSKCHKWFHITCPEITKKHSV